MIEIKFTGNSWDALRDELQGFAVAHLNAKFGAVDLEMKQGAVHPMAAASARHEVAMEQAAETVASEPKQKRTRRTRAEIEADSKRQEATPLPVPEPVKAAPAQPTVSQTPASHLSVAPPPPLSMEQVTAALQLVWNKFGMDKSLECLQRFGCKRARELKEEQYSEFIAYCTETAQGAG